MKVFEDNYKAIEINVKNIKGEEFLLKSNFMDSASTKHIEEIGRETKYTWSEKVHKIMVVYFGRNEKFYQQFSLELLNKITDFVQEESKKN